MQYGLWKITDDKIILVDATEFLLIKNYWEYNLDIDGSGLDEHRIDYSYHLSIHYGKYLPNPDVHNDNEIEAFLMSTRKSLYNCFNFENKTYEELKIIDLVYDFNKQTNTHAIIALARLSENLKSQITKNRGISSFLRDIKIHPLDNIFNRPGILSLKDIEKRITGKLTRNNWKKFIDYSRLERVIKKWHTPKMRILYTDCSPEVNEPQ